ncbi:MAG: DUF4433 domain-containing protein [candidate division KSB1 bacterium]|nr:DUF4433 domain-containing protein [candidate division KSB1 bacterium]
MTHIDNLESIIKENGLWSDSERIRRNLSYNKIGYQHIKDRRMRRKVNVGRGGCLGDYVPFYFAPRSPMLYTINKGNVPDYQDGQEPIIHLVSNIDLVIFQNSQFVYTDRHAELSHAEYSNNLDAISNVRLGFCT